MYVHISKNISYNSLVAAFFLFSELTMTLTIDGGGGGVIDTHKHIHRKFKKFGEYDFLPKSVKTKLIQRKQFC